MAHLSASFHMVGAELKSLNLLRADKDEFLSKYLF